MANKTIPQLPAATTIIPGVDVLPISHSGVTQKATPNQVVQAVLPSPGPIGGTTPSAGAFSALTVTGASGIQKAVAGLFTNAVAGTDYIVPGGALGTPSSGTLTNCTGLPVSTGISGLGTGVATFLATPSSANLKAAVTDETGSGALVFANTPTLVTPNLGTPASGTLTNCSGLPIVGGTTGTLTVARGGTGATNLTGLVKGNGSSAFTAAVSGADYAPATSGNSILYGNNAGGFSNVTVGSGLSFAGGTLSSTSGGGTVTSVSVVSANGLAGTVANPTTTPAITLSTTASGILYGNSGALSPVTVGSGLTFAGGVLSATGGGMVYPGAGIPNSTGSAWGTSYGTSGVNSVVLRDSSGNISTNSIFEGYSVLVASGTTTTLTASSFPNWYVTGSGGQTFQLPDATTLPDGATYTFNNNQSSGVITLNNNSGSSIIPGGIGSGGYVTLVLQTNVSPAGTWDYHFQTPANVSWTTNTFNYPGSFTGGTWNGSTVAVNRGGTGATTLTGLVKGNGTSAFTAAVSGTDYAPATSGTSILYGNGLGGFSPVTIGSGLIFTGGTLASVSGGGGTVTNVSVVSANGFGGTVANPATAPAITLTTSVTGLLKGNGTGVSAAVAGTDYAGLASNNTFTDAQTISVSSSSDALRITQTGAGNALVVEDSANPDASRFVVDASGNVGIGQPTPDAKLVVSGAGVTSRIESVAATPVLQFYRCNNTIAAPTSVTTGATLTQIKIAGYDGSAYIPAAQIDCVVDGTPGTNDMPGRLVLSTTADGASSPTERMRIDSSGLITATGGVKINGTTTLATSLTGLLKSASGVVSAATSGTDYAPATSGTSILYGNGAGGFSNVTIGGNLAFSGGTLSASAPTETWTYFTASGTYTVPAGISSIRAYAGGGGGNGSTSTSANVGGGGGGGFAYGDIAVTPGQTVTISISSGVATVTYASTAMLTANKGANASGSTGGAGGTASKNVAVTNGGAYSGGAGGSTNVIAGGGSCGSPLGNGFNNGTAGSGAGIGSAGVNNNGGGAGANSNGAGTNGESRPFNSRFTDPLLTYAFFPFTGLAGGPGAGGGGSQTVGYAGGDFGGGGSVFYSGAGIGSFNAGNGGVMGGGGGGYSNSGGTTAVTGGNGGLGGGGGSARSPAGTLTAGTGGGAFVFIYA
jgi:hypothetical protein